ncbi:hypothetical protein ACWDA7_40405 [Streptomyces sp. NPDC001156]
MQPVTKGLLSGAAGTTVLNLTTYADMLLRGRPSSDTPAQVADRLVDRTGIDLRDGQTKSHGERAVDALLGYVTGLGVGAAYGLMRRDGGPPSVWAAGPLLGAGAMAGSDLPAGALGVTDPATWDLTSWASDVVPHLVNGFTALPACTERCAERWHGPAVRMLGHTRDTGYEEARTLPAAADRTVVRDEPQPLAQGDAIRRRRRGYRVSDALSSSGASAGRWN